MVRSKYVQWNYTAVSDIPNRCQVLWNRCVGQEETCFTIPGRSELLTSGSKKPNHIGPNTTQQTVFLCLVPKLTSHLTMIVWQCEHVYEPACLDRNKAWVDKTTMSAVKYTELRIWIVNCFPIDHHCACIHECHKYKLVKTIECLLEYVHKLRVMCIVKWPTVTWSCKHTLLASTEASHFAFWAKCGSEIIVLSATRNQSKRILAFLNVTIVYTSIDQGVTKEYVQKQKVVREFATACSSLITWHTRSLLPSTTFKHSSLASLSTNALNPKNEFKYPLVTSSNVQ